MKLIQIFLPLYDNKGNAFPLATTPSNATHWSSGLEA